MVENQDVFCLILQIQMNSFKKKNQESPLHIFDFKRTLYSEKNMNSLNVEYFLAMNIQIWEKMDNPFKRYDFSKFELNSVKSLCRPHKLATVPCHGCTTPHW